MNAINAESLKRFENKNGDIDMGVDTLTVKQAADLMGKTEQFVRIGLQRGILPFGWAVKITSQWSYFISRRKFEECTGIAAEVK